VYAWRTDAGLAIWLVNLTGIAEHGTVSRVGPVMISLPGAITATVLFGASTVHSTDGNLIVELPFLGEWECVLVNP
jgi:hypothetical protein